MGLYVGCDVSCVVFDAIGGMAFKAGVPDREPLLPPGNIADDTASMYAVFAIECALIQQHATGAGQVIDTPVSSLDFLPTFCQLSGASLPSDLALDGTSIATNFTEFERTKPLVWCYYNAINEHRVAMRHGEWKVLAKLNNGKMPKSSDLHTGNAAAAKAAELTDIEIYRISEDIAESKNLAAEHPNLVRRLQAALFEWNEEMPADAGSRPRKRK